ncbi:hypothetical protein BOTBODRAFT_27233 [Botryobasidium botryosum FD-172 SS1]|uniref:Uncharacterized protein n=1 Tax=Botryobasidium botryosum (strain FD-172 SS1) TaxID=930990 RepID=A0A067N7T8_BOTB1|nr:hypothetical protein BOTBODRAFT_27233 [Botryobasidium botryosum FD-172 SS1]
MKLSGALSFVLLALPAIEQVTAATIPGNRGALRRRAGNVVNTANNNKNGGQNGNNNKNGGQNGNTGKNGGQNGNNGNNNGNGNNGNGTSSGNNNNNNGGNNGGNNNNDDPQSSLQLDPSQVQTGLEQDGNGAGADPGQVASLTSSNNFMNFCITQTDVPLTNGQQIKTGSCNPTIMGRIIATDKMPSCKFQSPANLDVIQSNQDFTVNLAVNNMETGNFVNATSNYFAAPAQVNGQGLIVAHSHIVIEKVNSLTDTTVLDPTVFAFFKGLNEPAVNGILSATVTGGLQAGVYRMSSINTASNHQPVLVAVAQHGSLDDMVYFTVSDDPSSVSSGNNGENNNNSGNNNSSSGNNNNNNGTSTGNNGNNNNNKGGAASTTTAAKGSTTTAKASATTAASGGKNGGTGNNTGNNKGGNNTGNKGANGNTGANNGGQTGANQGGNKNGQGNNNAAAGQNKGGNAGQNKGGNAIVVPGKGASNQGGNQNKGGNGRN